MIKPAHLLIKQEHHDRDRDPLLLSDFHPSQTPVPSSKLLYYKLGFFRVRASFCHQINKPKKVHTNCLPSTTNVQQLQVTKKLKFHILVHNSS